MVVLPADGAVRAVFGNRERVSAGEGARAVGVDVERLEGRLVVHRLAVDPDALDQDRPPVPIAPAAPELQDLAAARLPSNVHEARFPAPKGGAHPPIWA